MARNDKNTNEKQRRVGPFLKRVFLQDLGWKIFGVVFGVLIWLVLAGL